MGQSAGDRRRVLLAEDEGIVSLDLEEQLTAAGYDVAGPFATSSAARRWLADNAADLAIIDYRLADGPAVDLARELQARGVPFLVYTGWHLAGGFPPELRDTRCIEKPSPVADVLGHLLALTAATASTLRQPA